MTCPVSRRLALRVALFCIAIVLTAPHAALAHALGENYVFVNFRDDGIDGRFEIQLQATSKTNSG